MITRFAPSPTGPLHLGHAYSAIVAHDLARAQGGTFLLRIEDIDRSRARDKWEQQIYHDLSWLGLNWDAPPIRQSDHLARYRSALNELWCSGYLYPCNCRRADIAAAVTAPQEGAPLLGPDGVIYPRLCYVPKTHHTRLADDIPSDTVLRLDMRAAVAALKVDKTPITYTNNGASVQITANQLVHTVGDVVLARRDMGTSYHLSVVVDDAAQSVTDVVRGEDLDSATAIHVVLQRLLNLPTPQYHHHRLIRDDAGKRLAKRDDARALSTYRAQGLSSEDIRRLVGL
ncbi:tRNA glutamyl-Q(34) synthetase GluQRS [Nereida sp.]|uniref:tRNA glutamyl-Q(34) synthetase GluQRS n=1 Tax=Nereida sp. TaxID=2736090 RepID=UPI003F69A0C0